MGGKLCGSNAGKRIRRRWSPYIYLCKASRVWRSSWVSTFSRGIPSTSHAAKGSRWPTYTSSPYCARARLACRGTVHPEPTGHLSWFMEAAHKTAVKASPSDRSARSCHTPMVLRRRPSSQLHKSACTKVPIGPLMVSLSNHERPAIPRFFARISEDGPSMR